MHITPLTHNRYGRYLFFYAPRWSPRARRQAAARAAFYDTWAIDADQMASSFQPPPWR